MRAFATVSALAAVSALSVVACSSGSGATGTSSGAGSGSGSSSGGSGSASGWGDAGSVALSVSNLSFAVVGDTRPADPCVSTTDCGYPTAVIQNIFTSIKSFSPAISLVTATGDYQYTVVGSGLAAFQVMQNYLPAAEIAQDAGILVFPTMGNHECDGLTDSNCVPGGGDTATCLSSACGVTENVTAYLDMLGALGIPNTTPYYSTTVTIAGGDTAKFVFVAPNAWDTAQSSWLTSVLAQKTTYTFLVQHEQNNLDSVANGMAPSSVSTIRSIVAASGTPASGETYPITLWLVGHTHNYDYDVANQQVINGLGGAPLDTQDSSETSSTFYSSAAGGYMVCAQQSTGSPPAIQCALYAAGSNTPVGNGTTFAVNADGTTATVQ